MPKRAADTSSADSNKKVQVGAVKEKVVQPVIFIAAILKLQSSL